MNDRALFGVLKPMMIGFLWRTLDAEGILLSPRTSLHQIIFVKMCASVIRTCDLKAFIAGAAMECCVGQARVDPVGGRFSCRKLLGVHDMQTHWQGVLPKWY